jgi:hypothetical protein
MKKLQILAAMMLLVSINISAANQFSMSPNDTVRIHPNRLDGYSQQVISMETDGYCDTWNISMSYPDGMMVKLVSGITPMTGMCVDYLTAQGEWQTYEPQLQVSAAYANISATTSALFGFYDYGAGVLIPYGSVKWEPGTRQMFSLNLYIEPTFREGWLIMDAVFNSSADSRGPILSNVRAYKRTYVFIGYERGDVNGDGRINITDVTVLNNALAEQTTNGTSLDEFQQRAADMNGDGIVNITDVTMLINYINAQ